MRQFLLYIVFTLSSPFILGQFDLITYPSMAIEANGWFGNGASFVDFNDDGYDDLTFCSNTQDVRFFQNNGLGGFFVADLGIDIDGDTKQPLWFDFDNDGDKDFFCSRNEKSCKLFRNDEGNFVDISASCGILQTTAWKTHGTSCGDYNNDGYLDLYICNYNNGDAVTNYLYRNNGNGTFTDVTASAGVANGSKTTFDATWLDYDKDGDQDLILINDRVFFANAFYRNNGNGTFTDIATDIGFDHTIDAMSITCGDYDNDGDFDIYVANGQDGNLFLEYNGNHFADIAETTGTTVNSVCWGAIWVDYDCNMTQDLYSANYPYNTTSSTNHFFVNNGIDGFSHENDVIDNETQGLTSPVLGDVTNDGYPDIALNTATASQSAILHNMSNSNNWLKVNLEGVVSNRDAIGSLVQVWSNGVVQSKVKFGSSNFMAQDSEVLFFGLGSSALADSLIVTWPSGFKDKLNEVTANEVKIIAEGQSLTPTINFSGDGCEGSSYVLMAQMPDAVSYLWEDGTESSILQVFSDGTYTVEVTNSFGISSTASVNVTFNPSPLPEINITPVTCADMADGVIEIFSTSGIPIETILWEGIEQTGTMVSMLPGGEYPFTVIDVNGCTKDSIAFIPEPSPILADLNVLQPLCFGETGSATVDATGGTGELEVEWSEEPVDMNDGDYEVAITDENSCTVVLPFQIIIPEELVASETIVDAFDGDNGSITLDIEGGTEPYSIQWSDGQTGPVASGIGQGVYSYVISDANNCLLSGTASIIDLTIANEQEHNWHQVLSTSNGVVISAKQEGIALITHDATGRVIEAQIVPPYSTLEIGSNLPYGIYYLQLVSQDKQLSQSLRIFIGR